jgi:hypothetical protein
MPLYNPGFGGEYTNNLILPESLGHIAQFCCFMEENVWGKIKQKTKELQAQPNSIKIKPSSYNAICQAQSPHFLVKKLIREHRLHLDNSSEFVVSGGIHDAINNIIMEIALELGASEVNQWVGVEDLSPKLTEKHKTYARLLQHTYKVFKPQEDGEWVRLDDYDTVYSCVWFNGKQCIVSVVAPAKRYMQIQQIKKVDESALIECFVQIHGDYPELPLIILTHSFGYDLFLNALESSKIQHVYAFNPCSTIQLFNTHRTTYFINLNDVLCKRGNLFGVDIFFGEMLENHASAHSISQWE